MMMMVMMMMINYIDAGGVLTENRVKEVIIWTLLELFLRMLRDENYKIWRLSLCGVAVNELKWKTGKIFSSQAIELSFGLIPSGKVWIPLFY